MVKYMKRIFATILLLCMVFTLSACGSTGNSDKEQDGQNIQNSESDISKGTEKEEDTSAEDGKITYKVMVVDEDKNPVAGAMVQMCKDACVPARTNADGVAEFNLEETDGYKVSVLSLPTGYVYDGEAEIYLESEQTELTITVKTEV